MRKKTKKQKFVPIALKIKRYLYYEKKITPRITISNEEAINLFFEDQNIKCEFDKIGHLIHLKESGVNEVLNTRTFKSRKAFLKDKKKNKEVEKHKRKYYDYLQSNEWQVKRNQLFDLKGRVCERCNKDLKGKIADVHHKTYENIFNEKLDDLEVLCRPCHQEEHKDKRHSKDKKPKNKISFHKKCEMLKTKKGRKKLRKMGFKIKGNV